jgi:hypothetical protein
MLHRLDIYVEKARKSIWRKGSLHTSWDERQAGAWRCNPHQRLFPTDALHRKKIAPQFAVGFFIIVPIVTDNINAYPHAAAFG